MNISTIIFDLDGTLIDTEKYFKVFWRQAAEEFGFHMTEEQALSLRSLTLCACPFERVVRRNFRLYGSEGLPQKADAGAPCKGGAGTETGGS